MKHILLVITLVTLGLSGPVPGQSLIHSGAFTQPAVQPMGGSTGVKLFTYSLSGNPLGQTQAAQEILSQPSNYDYHQMVVGLVRLRGDDRTVQSGMAKLYRLGPDAQGRIVLLEQKVGLQFKPSESLSPRPSSHLTFVVVPFGMEQTVNLQPQAAPMTVTLTGSTVGTQTLELGLADGTGQMLDGRRLTLVQVTGPEVPEPNPGSQMNQLVVGPRPITNPSQVIFPGTPTVPSGWNQGRPPSANLVRGTGLPVAVPHPEPIPDPGQPKTGTHQPVQQYLTTGGVHPPVYMPPPSPGERSGLKSLPPYPVYVVEQTPGKGSERKNHRP